VIVVLLFIGSLYLRSQYVIPPTMAFVLSFVAVGFALITGWLGGELIVRLGIGVDSGANVDAPSSLSTPFASPRMTDRIGRDDDDIRRAG